MIKLYILTEERFKHLHKDDQTLLFALESLGIQGIPSIWTKLKIREPINVLVRTPWNYTQHYQSFLNLLNEIEFSNSKCINSVETLKWNINKHYLFDLEQSGIKIIPTKIFYNVSLSDFILAESLFHLPIVIKPLIGAGGVDTFLIHDNCEFSLCNNLIGQDVLIQPYVESIKTKGEYSFIFFGNKFSHAVVKQNKPEEFRIQSEYGGTVKRYYPNEKELDMVLNILQKTNRYFPYLRLDVVYYHDELVIMELEAIEPELFFRFSDSSINYFVKAIAQELCNKL